MSTISFEEFGIRFKASDQLRTVTSLKDFEILFRSRFGKEELKQDEKEESGTQPGASGTWAP